MAAFSLKTQTEARELKKIIYNGWLQFSIFLVFVYLLLGLFVLSLFFFYADSFFLTALIIILTIPCIYTLGVLIYLFVETRKFTDYWEIYKFSEQTFEIETEKYSTKIEWSEIAKVEEKTNYFIIYHSEKNPLLISKQGLLKINSLDLFKNFIKNQIGERAKFINTL